MFLLHTQNKHLCRSNPSSIILVIYTNKVEKYLVKTYLHMYILCILNIVRTILFYIVVS